MLNIFGMSRKVAREGTETRLTPVHWEKKVGAYMAIWLVGMAMGIRETYLLFVGIVIEQNHSFLYLTAISLSYQHVQSSLKL